MAQTPIEIKLLGLVDYYDTWQSMRRFTDQRTDQTPDELWVVEHPPIYTQGQAGKPEHLLRNNGIAVVQTDRGGQITYHGTGQLIIYPLLDIKRKKLGVREFVTRIEQSVIKALAVNGIESVAKSDAPGVYVRGEKIASLGLRVRRGCSFHGVSINVAMDLAPFLSINPCGYARLRMTQVRDHDPNFINFDHFKQQYIVALLAELECFAVDAE